MGPAAAVAQAVTIYQPLELMMTRRPGHMQASWDSADHPPGGLPSGGPTIPRISRDIPQTAAFGGIWLHTPDTTWGHRVARELLFLVVAGVGFEPT